MAVVTVETLVNHINSGVRLVNMELDLKSDLVMCFNMDLETVAKMSMHDVVRVLDEKDEEENFPDKYTNQYGIKCTKCGCEVGFEFNDHTDSMDSVCRCGHVDYYSEYYFDALSEQMEIENALNSTMKKVYKNLNNWLVESQHNNVERVNEIREHGYKIQEFETCDDHHEFYMLDGECMYLRTSHIHKNTEVLKAVMKVA